MNQINFMDKDQSIPEEIFNGITHGIGALLSIAGTAVLVVFATIRGTAVDVVSSSIYGATLILLFLISALYHSITHQKAKKVFQVLDHCSIFLLILGTYTPLCLSFMPPASGWILWGVNAAITVVGVTFNAIDLHRWHKASLWLYVLMGWSVVFAIGYMYRNLSPQGIALLFSGGLFYTVGIVFYKLDRKFFHSIWHLFVLGGALAHYFLVLFHIIGKRPLA